MTLVVNLFAGPGAGKSTMAAGLFHRLKTEGVNCELVREYAKDLEWRGHREMLTDAGQIYVFAKQLKRFQDVDGKVDIIVTDSPILLSAVYGKSLSNTFCQLVLEEVAKFNNMNVILKRVKPYVRVGRSQTKQQAEDLDMEISGTVYGLTQQVDLIVPGDEEGLEGVLSAIRARMAA